MLKAKKKFGQNFLKDESILTQIIQAIPKQTTPDFGGRVVEIGPGLGDLTSWLLKSGYSVSSYEIDDDLVPHLEQKFADFAKDGRFKLIHKDANLAWDEQGSLLDRPYIMVANLPYYVATKMVLNALKDGFCAGVIAMVQKEVAIKFTCKGRESEFSSLGVLANINAKTELLFDVAPECFEPAPKVMSSVFKISKEQKLIAPDGVFASFSEYEKFQSFLKSSFSSPRKTLLKNLSQICDKAFLNEAFASLELSQNIRPHELNALLYLKIYNIIKAKNERKQ
ncbi:16S rRNA (adenine(1518)-N(6)/adenine(1519)-N(6))-dimethyltransferase RsmA [Campylobacter suis]|uniref:Ribosomal RNA small subunit methyltransferase A n=1 Tax=Campylobacter suis TaxID=2790657 RepID=A0ABN7K6J0_9BACT|nr:16S rRNA (adenine(1518)-N(6)/adenine(1519)-N(6))-dimethyltransferase RsmA [Campylobacter suis]CAD7288092.1 Ribosomal RNA small subunit methyltransferase A [Campylobacter suis]